MFPRRAFSSGCSISLEGNVAIDALSITLDNVLLKPCWDVPTIHNLLGLWTFRYQAFVAIPSGRPQRVAWRAAAHFRARHLLPIGRDTTKPRRLSVLSLDPIFLPDPFFSSAIV
jgi:hypothetical protein